MTYLHPRRRYRKRIWRTFLPRFDRQRTPDFYRPARMPWWRRLGAWLTTAGERPEMLP